MGGFLQLVVSTFDSVSFPAHFKLAMKLLRNLFDCDLDEMKKRYVQMMMMMMQNHNAVSAALLEGNHAVPVSVPFCELHVAQ